MKTEPRIGELAMLSNRVVVCKEWKDDDTIDHCKTDCACSWNTCLHMKCMDNKRRDGKGVYFKELTHYKLCKNNNRTKAI